MNLNEAHELAAAIRRACPKQTIDDAVIERWPSILTGLRYSECLVAVASLAVFQREVWPNDILGRVQTIRRNKQEPGGVAWEARKARHGGEEFQGGAVCWPPDICGGSCATCPNEAVAS